MSSYQREHYYCASNYNNHEVEEFTSEDEDKELVSNCDDEVLSEDEDCSSESLHQALPFQEVIEDGRASHMIHKTTYLFPDFSKQHDSILKSGITECKCWFDMTHLIASVTDKISTKIGIVTDSRTTTFLFPTPCFI